MTCRAAATPDLPAPRPVVHHDVDFSLPSPLGFALCKACGDYVTIEQWAAWPCPGAPRDATFAPVLLSGEVPCALCGVPIVVDPMHRVVVEWFGTTCAECFGLVEVGA